MRYKLTSAFELRKSATGKARLLEVRTDKDIVDMWVPVASSEFCAHGKWEVDDWWIEQQQEKHTCEIYTE